MKTRILNSEAVSAGGRDHAQEKREPQLRHAGNQAKARKTDRNLWRALSAALLLAIPFVSRGEDVPPNVNYQGRLTDTLGEPLSSGYYEIKFLIWNDAIQNGSGNLIWGRTFAVHVVKDGIFNILLNDNGTMVTQPSVPKTNSLLHAFGGPRWLGLTITISNNVPVSVSEISPRQQLASAPFALQAQKANEVGLNGVSTESLQAHSVTGERIAYGTVTETNLADNSVSTAKLRDNAVTTSKLGDGQVTTAKIGNNQVTTAKIGDGQVTAAKLDLDSNVNLKGHELYLTTDNANGLKHDTTFGGTTSLDGPVLFGNTTGVLGTTSGGAKVALSWQNNGGVSLFGAPIDITSGNFPTTSGNGSDPPPAGSVVKLKALTDGLFIYYDYAQRVYIQVYEGGSKALFDIPEELTSQQKYRPPGNSKNYGMFFNPVGEDDSFGKQFMWPMRKNDEIRIYLHSVWTAQFPARLYFIPLGTGVGTSSTDVITKVN